MCALTKQSKRHSEQNVVPGRRVALAERSQGTMGNSGARVTQGSL